MCIFIDIHTHQNNCDTTFSQSIKNVSLPNRHIPSENSISIGYHPWFIGNHSLSEMKVKLDQIVNSDNVFAIGECGLDRSIESSIDLQIPVFLLHLSIAEQFRKPIIVHCVKAYSDLLEILKNKKISIPIILHGFNANTQMVSQLLKHDIYFSFGKSLFGIEQKITNTIHSVPLNRLFLETDESAYSIEKIYLRAAELLNISSDELKGHVYRNFKHVFKNGLVKSD